MAEIVTVPGGIQTRSVKGIALEHGPDSGEEMVRTSVIVITHNGRHHLDSCLSSIARQTVRDFETILIDNASRDGSPEFVRANFPWVHLISSETNLGFAAGNNLAAKSAAGEILVFLNDDTEVDPDWLEKLLAPFRADIRIGVVGSRMVDFFHRETEILVWCDVLGSAINLGIKRGPPRAGFADVFYVPGFAMAIRRDLFFEIGGFDESYFMFAEDIDLDWRVLLAGYRMVCAEDSVMYHKFGGSVPGAQIVVDGPRPFRTSLWKRELGERNLLTTLLKNYGLLSLCWVLPSYLLIFLLEVAFFIANQRRDIVRAYARALMANVEKLREIRRFRGRIHGSRRIRDREIIRQMHVGSAKLLQGVKTGFRVEIRNGPR